MHWSIHQVSIWHRIRSRFVVLSRNRRRPVHRHPYGTRQFWGSALSSLFGPIGPRSVVCVVDFYGWRNGVDGEWFWDIIRR